MSEFVWAAGGMLIARGAFSGSRTSVPRGGELGRDGGYLPRTPRFDWPALVLLGCRFSTSRGSRLGRRPATVGLFTFGSKPLASAAAVRMACLSSSSRSTRSRERSTPRKRWPSKARSPITPRSSARRSHGSLLSASTAKSGTRARASASRWEDVDLERNLLRVERAWDAIEGVIEPKSKAGRRTVPIAKALRTYLLRHQLASGRRDGLAFGRTPIAPFDTGGIWKRSRKAWTAARLTPLTLHEARHTFASLMIAAGVNAKALTTYMGHASVRVTFDRYGHLMPGNESEAAGLLDDYLEKATGAQTGAHSL